MQFIPTVGPSCLEKLKRVRVTNFDLCSLSSGVPTNTMYTRLPCPWCAYQYHVYTSSMSMDASLKSWMYTLNMMCIVNCQVWGFAGTWWRIKHADHSHFSTQSWHLWQCEIFILMIFVLLLPHLLKAHFVNIEFMMGVGHTVKHDQNQKRKGQQ